MIKNELSGWKKWEVIWLATAVIIIMGLSIYWGDSAMGIISSITGVACVVLTGKGKLSAYLFGLINCVLYSIISYKALLYGETMLNALYYIPMQFVGFYVWNKHINPETNEVKKKRMNASNFSVLVLAIAAATFLYGIFLRYLGDAMPFVDSFTTVASVAAMIVSVKMYAEQWWIWVAVDVLSIYMWWNDFMSGSDNIATLLMWAVYLVNAIIMLVKWENESKENKMECVA